jgi:hypothetical protein
MHRAGVVGRLLAAAELAVWCNAVGEMHDRSRFCAVVVPGRGCPIAACGLCAGNQLRLEYFFGGHRVPWHVSTLVGRSSDRCTRASCGELGVCRLRRVSVSPGAGLGRLGFLSPGPVLIALGLFAWAIGVLESTNLWDYLIDPWLAVGAIFQCLKVAASLLVARCKPARGGAANLPS